MTAARPFYLLAVVLFTCGLLCSSSHLQNIYNDDTGYRTYKGYEILTVQPGSEKDMNILRKLDKILEKPIDYLKMPHGLQDIGHLLVEPTNLRRVKRFLTQNRLNFKARSLHISPNRNRRALQMNDSYRQNDFLNNYLSFDDHMRIVDGLVAANPQRARVKIIANSTEGRPIKIIRIGYPSAHGPKPTIWIDSGIHAREWIAYPVGLYFIQQLIENPKYSYVLSLIDVVVAPNVNPDGYEYSRTRDRMWRKTRSYFYNNRCPGTDGNRNYPFHFGEEGISWESCSEIYPGPYDSSEPEVAGLIKEITAEREWIKVYISLHSFGQEILYPWGHITNAPPPPDVKDLISLGEKMRDAMMRYNGTKYTVKNSGAGLYAASGASDDWAKSIGVKYSYTIELSPIDFPDDDNTGIGGFLLQESEIPRVCHELLQALNVLINQTLGEFVVRPTKIPKPVNSSLVFRRRAKKRRSFGRFGRTN